MLVSGRDHSCSKKETADIVAINIVLQNNAFAILDIFEHYKNENAISAIETVYTASIVTCAYMIKENNLTMEDISNSLFELQTDMIKNMGSKEARRFSATIEPAFFEFKKNVQKYLNGMENLNFFKELELQMGKKNTEHI